MTRLRRLSGWIAAVLMVGPCLAQQPERIEDYLAAHDTRDPIARHALATVRGSLPGVIKPAWTKAKAARLFVTDFQELPARFYPYRTDSCTGVHSLDGTPLIVCNEAFLLGAEIAIRRFEEARDLLSREKSLIDFVRWSRVDATAALQRLRSDKQLAAQSDQSAEHIGAHLSIALLFFASHELGHLVEGTDFGRYSEPASGAFPDAAIRAAVLRTCRQVDEFNRYEFGLPGLERLIKTGEDARKVEEQFRSEVADVYEATSTRFIQEEAADRVAIEAILSHLASVDKTGAKKGLEQQHLFMETLFALAVYRWYSDLTAFADNTCGEISDSRDLAGCMMENRERYVTASRVFGDVHRFIFLRSIIAMNAVARERMHYYTGSGVERSIWPERKKIDGGGDGAVQERWRSGDLQRFWLLRILVDTPVKFAYTACFTGWFVELDKQRGRPQIFVMTFEPIEAAIGRLRSIP